MIKILRAYLGMDEAAEILPGLCSTSAGMNTEEENLPYFLLSSHQHHFSKAFVGRLLLLPFAFSTTRKNLRTYTYILQLNEDKFYIEGWYIEIENTMLDWCLL